MENAHDNSFNELCTHATTDAAQRYINASVPDVNVPSILGCLKDRKIDDDKKLSLSRRIDALIRLEEDRKGYKESYNFTQTDEIKRYCLDRLEEIRVINEVFHVPSGFVCIAAFIGFLSRLAYGTNKKHREDASTFMGFVKKFMPSYDAEDMYSTLRCGIVHAMSFHPAFANGRPSDKPTSPLSPPVYSITHSESWTNLAQSTTNGIGRGIQSAALCNDIENAIKSMFDDPLNQIERDNAVKTLAWQPAITGKSVDPITKSQLSD